MRRCARLSFLLPLAAIAAAPPNVDAPVSPTFDRSVAAAKAAMMSDPGQALKWATGALAEARRLPNSPQARIAVATGEWLAGEAHLYLNEDAEAGPLIEAAVAIVEREAPGSKLLGDLMRSRGAVAEDNGRMQEALQSYQHAYAIFTALREDRSRAITLQDIGRIYSDAGDLDRTLRFYEQSADLYNKDPFLLLTSMNGKGDLLARLGRRREAEASYRAALAAARAKGSPTLQVRVLTNLAGVQVDLGELSAAAVSTARALQLAQGEGAAAWRPFVLCAAAKLAFAQGDAGRAATLLDQAFAGVNLATTDMEFDEYHELASRVYDRVGRPQLALLHLRAYQRLNSKARELTATYGAQLAAARFDFTSQNLRISTMKARQLAQQVEVERQRGHIRNMIAAGITAIILGIAGFMAFALVTGRRSRDRLRQVNVRLERALKAKTDFLAMTSHEIRTPLNGILGMTQVILTEPTLRPDLRDRLRVVQGAGETMKALVDDILDVAKMETGAVDLVEEDVDVARLLQEVAALWSDQARSKGLAFTCETDALPPRLTLDPGRLRQVTFNLLSNAVKFTEGGRVALTAKADGDRLVIAVVDTGIGIDAAQHEMIFEPFQQADASTTRRFGGTGLGLAISRKLAMAMGGRITLTSTLGSGATFTLDLPLVRAEAPIAVAPLARAPATSLDRAALLMVEANLMTQGMLAGLLEPHIGTLHLATSGEQARALLASEAIDAVLVEVASAGDDAGAALALLVEAAHARGASVSVLASPTSPVSLDIVAAAGADQIIMKPIGGGALIARLRGLYPTSRLTQEAA